MRSTFACCVRGSASPTGLASPAGCLAGSRRARRYKALLDELREAWSSDNSASRRLEHVGSPAIQHLIDQFTILLERRYASFAIVLPAGRVREEILDNVAPQLG
jgi:hypothetical protein